MLDFEVIDHAESPLGVIILRRRSPPDDRRDRADARASVPDEQRGHRLRTGAGDTRDRDARWRRSRRDDRQASASGTRARQRSIRIASLVSRSSSLSAASSTWVAARRHSARQGADGRSSLSRDQDDVLALLRRPPTKTHDLVLIDVDHSPDARLGESSDSFYAHANLALAKQHLEADGVFGVWSTSDESRLRMRALQDVSTRSASSRSSSSTRRSAARRRTGSSWRGEIPSPRLWRCVLR